MKKLIIPIIIILSAIQLKAQVQPDPAHWAYGVKKLTNNQYEVHLQCKIDTGWHIYAQKQTKDFIGTATKITFAKTPGLQLAGTPVEHGKKDIYQIKAANITNYEYAGTVDFVQKIIVKPEVKEVKVAIQYQTCTHKKCLPQANINLNVPLK